MKLTHRLYHLAQRRDAALPRAVALTMSCVLLATVIGCRPAEAGQGAVSTRQVSKGKIVPAVGTGERFGYRAGVGGAAAPSGESSAGNMAWTTPEGWIEVAATSMRRPNFVVEGGEGASEIQCYVTELSGDGGGIDANVNRWRGQIGLGPLTEAELAALERITVLDTPAVYVEFEGVYGGMGGQGKPNSVLAGALLELDDKAIFIKMVGPADAVRDQRANLREFLSSMHLHGGAAHASAASASGASASAQAAPGDSGKSSGGAGALAPGAINPHGELPPAGQKILWDAPDGWTLGPARPMRLVSYQSGASGEIECYITVLTGAAGGVTANLNRWRGQLGHGALSAAEIDALTKIDLLGSPTPLLDVSGSFRGDGGGARDSYAMLAVAYSAASQSIFVKMIGPADEVQAERENFKAFCNSIRMEE